MRDNNDRTSPSENKYILQGVPQKNTPKILNYG